MINSKKIPNKIRLIQSAQMVRELEKFEKKNAIQGFKFGILYAKEGQTKEEDFLSNTKGSEEYDDFLVFLGEKINLKGWNSFRAGKKKILIWKIKFLFSSLISLNLGLDVKNGSTGEISLFTSYQNNPIMFHVSTMLPYSKEKQQLERKRHICNDLVLLVFQEGKIFLFSDFQFSRLSKKKKTR